MAKLIERSIRVHAPEQGQGPLAAQALVRQLTGLPNATVRGMFDHGCVSISGERCTDPGWRLNPGDLLVVRYDPERKYRESPKDSPKTRPNRAFRLVYEDPHLVVVEKHAGVLTEPNKGETDTLVDYLASYLQRGARHKRKPWVVHRLDRETSGLLVLARRREVAEAIRQQFRSRKPERVYYAVAAGRVMPPEGTFRSHLATDKHLNQYSTHDPKQGKLAITHYRVLHHLEGATTLRIQLETGRRNQIRVHLSEAGFPLLGDPRYGQEPGRHPNWKARRVALHAARLAFTHPVTSEALSFFCPPPLVFEPFFPNGFPAE